MTLGVSLTKRTNERENGTYAFLFASRSGGCAQKNVIQHPQRAGSSSPILLAAFSSPSMEVPREIAAREMIVYTLIGKIKAALEVEGSLWIDRSKVMWFFLLKTGTTKMKGD
jgi:hypothetical protein